MYTVTVYEQSDYDELSKMSVSQIIETLADYQRAYHSSYSGKFGDSDHYQQAKYDVAFQKACDALYIINDLQRAKTDKEKFKILHNFFPFFDCGEK